jgi:hypothetical protein
MEWSRLRRMWNERRGSRKRLWNEGEGVGGEECKRRVEMMSKNVMKVDVGLHDIQLFRGHWFFVVSNEKETGCGRNGDTRI